MEQKQFFLQNTTNFTIFDMKKYLIKMKPTIARHIQSMTNSQIADFFQIVTKEKQQNPSYNTFIPHHSMPFAGEKDMRGQTRDRLDQILSIIPQKREALQMLREEQLQQLLDEDLRIKKQYQLSKTTPEHNNRYLFNQKSHQTSQNRSQHQQNTFKVNSMKSAIFTNKERVSDSVHDFQIQRIRGGSTVQPKSTSLLTSNVVQQYKSPDINFTSQQHKHGQKVYAQTHMMVLTQYDVPLARKTQEDSPLGECECDCCKKNSALNIFKKMANLMKDRK